MPKVIFISRALDGQTQPRATPVVARFIPGVLPVTKTAGGELDDGAVMRPETAGGDLFF
jgi:hypothetical protein